MSVIQSIEEGERCERRLRISVPEAAVAAERQRIEGEFRRRARIKGFRPGKAPLELVRQRHREDIQQELVERLVPRYWQQARAESALQPLLAPEIDALDVEGDRLEFTAVVEVQPELRIERLDGFELPDPSLEPPADEVDHAIDDLRRSVGTWIAVERAAGQGDRVHAHIRELKEEPEGEGVADPPAEDPVRFEIGQPEVWEEISVAATGLAAGQQTTFERREGEGDDTRLRRFRLRVETVEELELPPLDDALAARLNGDLHSLEELRNEVVRRLTLAHAEHRRRQREKAAIEQLRDRHPLELPVRLVQREVEELARRWAGEMGRQGLDLEQAEVDWQRLFEQLQPQAEGNVHTQLLLDAAAAQHEITVPAARLEEALGEIGRAEGRTSAAVRQRLAGNGGLERLQDHLRRQAVLRRITGEDETVEDTTVEES